MVDLDSGDLNTTGDAARLIEIIDNIDVDEDGHWKTLLLNDIMSVVKNTVSEKVAKKAVFTVGPEEISTSEGVENVNDVNSRPGLTELRSSQVAAGVQDANDKEVSALVRNLKAGTTAYDCASMNDGELMQLMNFGHLKQRDLEHRLGGDLLRAVSLRRLHLSETANIPLQDLPFQQYDYSFVNGSCCENVVGYVPIPTGIAGPLLVNGRKYFVPMSTTEGALVASTNRGCRAILESGGATARVYKDSMTRAPVVQFSSAVRALEMKSVLDSSDCFDEIRSVFNSTSNFAKLQKLDADVCGRLLFIRFEATTGDAMGMNMVSKGVSSVLSHLKKKYPEMEILSLSGNYCIDKKASSINWIKGRGKSVVAETTIPAAVVQTVLKTTVDAMVRLGQAKLLIGSSMAGSVGGWNAHAANVVAAIFIATGQDVAQVVSSSMCMTLMEKTEQGDLYITCNMRCLEVGTVGGGTVLPAQKACLEMLGCGGPSAIPGDCAKRLAEIICSTVMAGELSLVAAQCSNDLVGSHIRLNRSTRCLERSVDSFPVLRHDFGATLCSSGEQKNVKVAVALSKHLTTDKPFKIEMHCSNIL